MKITNNFNLPSAFVNFVRDGKYSKGNADISVTTLIDSPRIRLMKERHEGELVTDAVDMIWPLFGTAVHHILEHSDNHDAITMEERLFADIHGWILSGAIDHQEVLDNGTVQISDYKVTSAWSVIFGKKEWEYQQNCYAWLVENAATATNFGREVSGIRIVAILRDWNRRKAMMEQDYPQSPIVTVDLPLWSREEREEYVSNRIIAHQEAQIAFDLDGTLPLCSDEDQWKREDKWAVTKRGNKRANKLCDTEEEANQVAADLAESTGHKYAIDVRPGERTRCENNYCSVAEFCEQFRGEA